MYAEESLAYCSGQCQASRYPPATCRCPCQGRNHGVLRYRNPVIHIPREQVYEPSPYAIPERDIPLLPSKMLELTAQNIANHLDRTESRPIPQTRVEIRQGKARLKTTKRFLKAITGIRSQDDLNEAVLKGLRTQFNPEKVESIIDQAFTIRMMKNPEANRPELYELYETGDIDLALEVFNTRWVVGRPKIRN
jgi:hypothetical protein